MAFESRKKRHLVLKNEIWEEELMRLCSILSGPDSSVGAKKLWKENISKLVKIDRQPFNEVIIDLYFERQQLDEKTRFM
jgi:hypothetical protein